MLTEIGEMPVFVSISISEGFGGNTGRDFIRQEEAWIVADTEGSRVLKLNDELEIVDEVAVSTPYKLTASNGGLYVDSLGRTLRVNEDWTEVSETPSSFSSTTNVEKASLRLRLGDYQEDSETGLTWYYVDGRIFQHHIVKLGLEGSSVQRFYVDKFFDIMRLQEGTTEQPTFVLTSYKYQ
ncbi:hypothetical protein [Paenibacillus agaridevorans]|uniref:hypothetical protein n=1 Tax=Paenibacillus agaridevorans TaxID=171404 RepID=UPI001BE3EF53|nr:hypothetical protein [Paenibacillus agaridevorans]